MPQSPSRRLFLAILLAGLVSIAHAGAEDAERTPKAVRLVIDYNDGAQKVFVFSWKEGMTVMDAMAAAQAHRRGIQFKHTGGGETAFLTQIDDLKNEGRGADKRNWLYTVNDKFADQSFGVYKLSAGDVALWKFDVFRASRK